MTAEILKYREYKKVTYYVLHVEDRMRNEFADFQYRMKLIERYKEELQKILYRIADLGDKFGAEPKYFRHERAAEALPSPDYHYLEVDENGQEEYGLRLYCLRLTNEVVLLLNGDIKTTEKADDCPNCGKHFRFANRVSKAIDEAIVGKRMSIKGKKILMSDNFIELK